MNGEKFFREMYFNIWQSHDLSRFDEFYAKDFKEVIGVSDENKQPIELKMNYDDLVKQALWQKENYKNTTLDIKKIVMSDEKYIFVNFYSSSIDRQTGEMRYRYVCGLWELNREHKIDRVWAVVTPHYSA